MTNERVSYVCRRAAVLRKGKTVYELRQSDAFKLANAEWTKGEFT